jgi:hypothetical protein
MWKDQIVPFKEIDAKTHYTDQPGKFIKAVYFLTSINN